MMRFKAAMMATSLLGSVPAGAAIVDLDGFANAGLSSAVGVTLALGAGTYNVTPIIGQYTAWTRFDTITGCDALGAKCVTGFEHSYFVTAGATNGYGSNNGLGALGPQATGGYYDTAAKAFGFDATASSFTLAAPGNVTFWLYDDILTDNSGGVSLNVTAVPEPASWALMIIGFGLVGATLRRRALAAT